MAVQIQIEIKNLSKIKDAFAKYPETVAPFLRDASMKSAFLVEGAAKKVTPVDTGRLRASIATSLGIVDRGITSIVSTNVHYAVYVHEGTRRGMKARPYMKQGAQQSREGIEKVYNQEIDKALQRVASMTQ